MHDVDAAALVHLCTKLRIINQDEATSLPLLLNAEQRAFLRAFSTCRRIIVLKARQVGITTIALAYDLAFALANPGIPITLCFDTDANAKDKLGVIRRWAEEDLGMRLRVSSEHLLVLPNGSRFEAKTSGSRAGQGQSRTGRSGSAGLVHCSEVAFWPNDQRTFQSLMATRLRGARVIVESTATPANNLFRKLWGRASTRSLDDRPNAFRPLFLSLELHRAYREDPSSISDARWEQLRAEERFTRRDTAAWFEAQLQGEYAGDIHGLRQEFPPTPEAAFSHAVGRWIFRFVPAAPLVSDGPWTLYKDPKTLDEPVTIGVDTAKGTGGDYSAIVVMGCESRDVVATWYSNTTTIPDFTAAVREAMESFRPRATLIESNGVGQAVYHVATSWGFAGLAEQVSSVTNGEKHVRMTRLKWSVETGRTRVGPDMQKEIEGAEDVTGSTIDEDGDYVGRDDLLNATSFALKAIEASPWTRPPPQVDPYTYLAPTYLRRKRTRATGI